MSAICQYCGIAMGQVKRFEMEMARRFPEQENVGGCRYFGGWPVAKAGTQGRAANATKRGARETKAHGGLRVFPCPIGTKERALTWGARRSTITRPSKIRRRHQPIFRVYFGSHTRVMRITAIWRSP
jgi:hypothetical protein